MTKIPGYLAAEVDIMPPRDNLERLFLADGYGVQTGVYSVRLTEFDYFVFRELGGDPSEGCITADSDCVSKLIAQSQRVSNTLAKAGIRHRFEIYSEADAYVAYIHHDWPQGT